MNKRLSLSLLFVLAMWLAAGCASAGRDITTTPTPMPEGTSAATAQGAPTPTPIPLTETIAATMRSSTATSTPEPAETITPTEQSSTATPTRVPPTATRAPTATPRPSPTPFVSTEEPDIAATLVAGGAPRLYASYPSPDGALRAEVLIHDCTLIAEGQENAYDILNVVDAGGEIHFVDGQLQFCGGLGAFGLAGLFWSPSGRYFYYTEAREGVPDGCGYWTRPVSRVDTADWSTADLGNGPVSPDGSRLAAWDGRDLAVYDIDGGEVGRVAAVSPQAALGPIVWSPEGNALVYLQAEMFCIPGQSGATSVVRVEVPALTSEILLSSTSPAFQSVAWDAPIALDLVDDTGARWQYDFYSEELTRLP